MSVDLHRAGHRIVAMVSAVLLVLGVAAVIYALRDQQEAPQPPAAASASSTATGAIGATPRGSASSTPPPSRSAQGGAAPVALARSVPASLAVPSIGVKTSLLQLGTVANDEMEVPKGANYDKAGWYTGSPTPGEVGPAVIAGHVDGTSGPSVFFRLGALRPGDQVQVTRRDGKVVTYAVYRTERYAKQEFPTATVYGNTEGPELRLITCSGDIDPQTGHYRDNTVVYARLAA